MRLARSLETLLILIGPDMLLDRCRFCISARRRSGIFTKVVESSFNTWTMLFGFLLLFIQVTTFCLVSRGLPLMVSVHQCRDHDGPVSPD